MQPFGAMQCTPAAVPIYILSPWSTFDAALCCRLLEWLAPPHAHEQHFRGAHLQRFCEKRRTFAARVRGMQCVQPCGDLVGVPPGTIKAVSHLQSRSGLFIAMHICSFSVRSSAHRPPPLGVVGPPPCAYTIFRVAQLTPFRPRLQPSCQSAVQLDFRSSSSIPRLDTHSGIPQTSRYSSRIPRLEEHSAIPQTSR